jgi:3-oxoacyl-[acyl-carrier protein] reductase
VADRDFDVAVEVAREIEALGGRAIPEQADVSHSSEVDKMVSTAARECGRLDVLVHSAGIGFHKALLDTSEPEWDRIIQINLKGAFLCIQRAAREMIKTGGGKIVTLASISGQRGAMGRAAYGTAKAGVLQLTRIAAVELARWGICVNSIAPGVIRTRLMNYGPKQEQAYLERIPLKRFGTVRDIATAALFLVSADADYISGHTLNVDGGYHGAGLIFDYEELGSFRSGWFEETKSDISNSESAAK